MTIFEKRESQVRSYCRNFPAVFKRAKGAEQFDENGERYIDFFAGAGALNYGHNHPYIKQQILDYLSEDNVIHALDFFTEAKRDFLESFEKLILEPRGMDHKVMFCGPTGTNAVEAALKLARKNTGRSNIITFHGDFHGMTMGALSVTGASHNRESIESILPKATFMPFGWGAKFDTLEYLRDTLNDLSRGFEIPAAIILETIQAEGGVRPAPIEWLQGIRQICDDFGILMIVDDIQVGCGRAGYFFSFEPAGIVPDIITMSKSISGFGNPMGIVLMKPELDIFTPGEHNGTYRGVQLSLIGAKAALEVFVNDDIPAQVAKKHDIVVDFVEKEVLPLCDSFSLRGRGLIMGVDTQNPALAKKIANECFKRHLIMERSGRDDEVLKIMPPLIIPEALLMEGLEIFRDSIKAVLNEE